MLPELERNNLNLLKLSNFNKPLDDSLLSKVSESADQLELSNQILKYDKVRHAGKKLSFMPLKQSIREDAINGKVTELKVISTQISSDKIKRDL